MTSEPNKTHKISFRDLWRPYNAQVPDKFRAAIMQKEKLWSVDTLKGMLALWSVWYAGLLILSDLQKEPGVRSSYMLIRAAVIAISILAQIILRSEKISRTSISNMSFALGSLYLSSYVIFSHLGLTIRTTWVTILPAAFLLTTARSGRNSSTIYAVLVTIALLSFGQPINTIYIVSDVLFGFVLIGGGLVVKNLWIKSIVLMLEHEENQRHALQNEIKILEAVETFIPKGIRSKIRNGVSNGKSISLVIHEMSQPTEQHIAVLYSDFRNYSTRSASIEFIQNELITSSSPIIESCEQNDAIVQNRGDSLLAAFLGNDHQKNVCRALLSGIRSALSESIRVKNIGRNEVDRYMIVTSGNAVFCSLGNEFRQEITIAGKPANLAARLDEITKIQFIKSKVQNNPCVLFDFATKNTLLATGLRIDYEEIDLRKENLEVRTYIEEKRVYLLHYSKEVEAVLSNFLSFSSSNSEAA